MWLDSRVDTYRRTAVHEEILYIGMCYSQAFTDRIWQEWNDEIGEWLKKNKRFQLTLKLGTIQVVGRERTSWRTVKDVESLLIVTQDPPGNRASTKTYAGRELAIVNLGKREPLPDEVSTLELDWVAP
ncbi:hypothetical protein MYX77_07880 [Acidobacteriia bacterium AH_259_A11_L15]|nr:hypothetical protein [Acidobacteriia bacterium AH_259_A11_L15]